MRALPDGHTWLFTLDSTLAANLAAFGERMGFDPERDLAPVAIVGRYDQMLVVHAKAGITDFDGFVTVGSRGGLTYASAGIASPGHLAMAALQDVLGGQMLHVPFRGAAPAVQSLTAGQIDAALVVAPAVVPHVNAGRLRALAVSRRARSPLAPSVPTGVELGHPAAAVDFSFVLMAPRNAPMAVRLRLHDELRRTLTDDAFRARMKQMGIEPVGASPVEAAAELVESCERWARSVRQRGIRPQ